MEKLILIDGFAIMFRAYYASAYANSGMLQTKEGVYTNALVVFANLMEKIIEEATGHIMIAFDTKAKTMRHEAYEDYKAQRKPMPEELVMQVPLIKQLIDLWGIKQIGIDGYEADDVIGTVAKQASKKGYKVQIYSSDRDLLQLIDDNITVHLLRSGMKDVRVYDANKLYEEKQLTPGQIIDLKALMGDASDNIIGIPGVGEKTATKLLLQYKDVKTIYENEDELKGKVGQSIRDNKELVENNLFLVTIDTNVPIEVLDKDDLLVKGFNEEELLSFYEKYELNRLARKLKQKVQRAIELLPNGNYEELTIFNYNEEPREVVTPTNTDSNSFNVNKTILLNNEDDLIKVLNQDLSVYFEFDEMNYHNNSLWGVGLSTGDKNFFIKADTALHSIRFSNYLVDQKYEKYVFDLKSIIVFLNRYNMKINNAKIQLMFATYISEPNFTKDDINSVISNFGEVILKEDEEVYGKGAKRALPADLSLYSQHIASKAQAISYLKPIVINDLEVQKQSSLFYNIELPLSLILAKMEIEGIRVDLDELTKQTKEVNEIITTLENRIHNYAGHEFNIKSVKQLGEVLFEELKLPTVKKTKTGYSTNAEVLNKLKDHHPIINDLLEYRQLIKIYDTYLVGLNKVISNNNKIHTIYKQALTTTGRLSSVEPNLQNIPIRTETGRLIRKLFIPNENEVLIAVDYSQIELRVLAHIANVSSLLKSFANNEDIHSATAKAVFNVDEITEEHRRNAKAVNFGIIYGMGAWSLSEDLNITPQEAQEFINQYLTVYPEIKQYMEDIEDYAKEYGYVETILKRRRYLPGINSSNRNVQQAAKRTALNTPIQGSAADILKAAMIKVDDFITKNNYKTKMLLQVHDELIFTVPKDELELMLEKLPELMEKTYELKAKLANNISYGNSWYDL